MWWPHLREFGFWNQGIFSLWNLESWALQSGIKLNKSGIPLTIDWNPESKFHWQTSGIHDVESRIQYCLGFSYVGRDIKKKFKGVAHSTENNSSRFCLNVLKLMTWTGSIYFNTNLTFSFACLSKNNLRFRRSNFEQTFSLNEIYFVFFYITCLIHKLSLRASTLFSGSRESHARADTSSRGFAAFSRVLSRL